MDNQGSKTFSGMSKKHGSDSIDVNLDLHWSCHKIYVLTLWLKYIFLNPVQSQTDIISADGP